MKFIKIFASISAFSLLIGNASAQEWFSEAGSNCSGTREIQDALNAVTGGGVPIGGSAGHYFAILPVNSISTVDDISHVVTFDSSRAQKIRKIFEDSAVGSEIPFFAKASTTVLIAFTIPDVLVGAGVGLIFDHFYNTIDAHPISVRTVGAFVADGGIAYERRAYRQRKKDGNIFLLITTEYSVHVGNEERIFVIGGCTYPVQALVKQFETLDSANQKLILPDKDKWRIWDVANGKFEFEPLRYIYQAKGSYYFEQDVIENGAAIGQDLVRLSFIGGPWQFMYYNERPNGKYRTFYKNLGVK